jgi:hypothetical protein
LRPGKLGRSMLRPYKGQRSSSLPMLQLNKKTKKTPMEIHRGLFLKIARAKERV